MKQKQKTRYVTTVVVVVVVMVVEELLAVWESVSVLVVV